MPRLLVRRPSPLLPDGELTHLERVPADAGLALAQWEWYVEAFVARGWDVAPLPVADEHPDGVFVEDVVVVFDDLAVITRPGPPPGAGRSTACAPSWRHPVCPSRPSRSPARSRAATC